MITAEDLNKEDEQKPPALAKAQTAKPTTSRKGGKVAKPLPEVAQDAENAIAEAGAKASEKIQALRAGVLGGLDEVTTAEAAELAGAIHGAPKMVLSKLGHILRDTEGEGDPASFHALGRLVNSALRSAESGVETA